MQDRKVVRMVDYRHLAFRNEMNRLLDRLNAAMQRRIASGRPVFGTGVRSEDSRELRSVLNTMKG